MHQQEEGGFAAFIGIDWADKKHDVCLWVPGQAKRERLVLEHRPRAIQAWAEQLRERFAGAPVAVSIELAQGPIVSALLEHEFFVLFPVQPTTVARYRSAFTPSGAKDDPTDAEVVLELLLRHRDKLKPLQPERAQVRTLRRVVEGRRDLVHDRTRLTNRITNALKAYFPQVLEWFRDKDSAVFADFLERWPTLEAAQRARKDTLEAFFRNSNVRRTATIKRRIDAIREERPLHSDDAVTIPARMLVDALLPQLRALSASIARFDEKIARLAPQLPDYELFAALPGLARRSRRACWRPSASGVSGFPTPLRYRSSPESPPSSSAVATNPGSTGATAAASSSARPSSNGQRKPSRAPSGLKPSTTLSVRAALAIRLPFAP
jgi:hypothetical protein